MPSTPLSREELRDQLNDRFERFEKTLLQRFDDQDEILTASKLTLDHVAEKVDAIEQHLWNQQRFEEHERRIIALAERTGSPDLATPFTRPIGS